MSRGKGLSRFLFAEGKEPKEFWADRGAGILVFAKDTQRFLVLKRANWVNEPGTWGVAGGGMEGREKPAAAARREAEEELGGKTISRLIPAYVFKSSDGGFKFFNFIGVVEEEFAPRYNDESEDARWLSLPELKKLKRKHFGLEALLDSSKDLLEELVASPLLTEGEGALARKVLQVPEWNITSIGHPTAHKVRGSVWM